MDYDDKDFDNTGNDNRGCYSSYRSPQIKFDFNSNTLEGHPTHVGFVFTIATQFSSTEQSIFYYALDSEELPIIDKQGPFRSVKLTTDDQFLGISYDGGINT